MSDKFMIATDGSELFEDGADLSSAAGEFYTNVLRAETKRNAYADALFDEERAVVLYRGDGDIGLNYFFYDEIETEINCDEVHEWVDTTGMGTVRGYNKRRFLIEFKDRIECSLFKIRFNVVSTKEHWRTVNGLTNT
jgi:hypothetical protein